MKLTKSKLKKIIAEELATLLDEENAEETVQEFKKLPRRNVNMPPVVPVRDPEEEVRQPRKGAELTSDAKDGDQEEEKPAKEEEKPAKPEEHGDIKIFEETADNQWLYSIIQEELTNTLASLA